MTDVKALQQERISIYQDVYNDKIPKRVPVNIGLPFEVIAQFGGLDLCEAQWNPAIVEEAVDKICQTVYSDICVFMGSMRYPSFYEILKSQSFRMASNGFIQHPEVTGMFPEDYDYLIENPYDCLLERVIPRQYKAFNPEDPINCAINLAKSILAYNDDFMQSGIIIKKMEEKYGYYPGGLFSGGFTEAPFDFLSDQLRGFKGISMDIRRMPDKVAAACDALYPIVFKMGLPPANSNQIFIPLHMPPFMREKDFEKLYWPSFKRLLDEYASMGIHCILFCEHDWTRYLDYLYELPTDTILWFEYGDPKVIKEKLGKKHIITGLYPVMNLKTKTKEECVEEVKRYIDILAPGGKYIFNFDKTPLLYGDIKLECLCAVAETVRDYAVYSNAGETAGMVFNKEDYKVEPSRKFESKYYKTWEQYKALNPEVSDFGRPKLENLEETIFHYLMFLLV
ncbi:uroporphyrinogen decarboxylase family protein [Thermosediminibacter oceani]|uniref:Uroporphyrinogen decarboxylase (URO-D) domain-containing protein n=1 Tax=Thermosediminibacter oceani (strain ATCC BAA-1034 / DSM 16646 / JW/IW-1228P) TaxID=555079 RepID=D9S2C7_THEOJ|nr:uroporphyrinogen decarboxylase family protein [Thermosediminibacter oceani]ADL07554.1 conserved hypothetical protein [Thermosediminibacter oceani DSM 16646]